MNRYLTFKDVKLNIGEFNKNIPMKITERYNQSYIDIGVNKKYSNSIECDIKVTYKMITHLLDIPYRDLYYLFSEKQTVTKEEILHRLIEEDILKDIILNNLKETR